jgi:aryl-alcohol dehydrogenase-like predicted oxidoreductase
MANLITCRLGRTNRQVTTLGLGGQASIQWTAPDIDPISIIEKAYRLGINYFDTSNVYGPSQKNLGEAFKRLGLSPAVNTYDAKARKKIYVASKTHIRTARRPEGERFRSDFSEGMLDGFKVSNSVDDVRRSLSLLFGDGQGGYPEGAYLDCIQFHNINTMDEVDMLFEGLENPQPDRPWMGSLAAMLDLREGTNTTGCNPKREKLVKHIGISGHWNTAAHIYAIQRDYLRILDTLLVAINPSDCHYLGHRFNAIATAAAADMGIIGMKIFADAAYYHKDVRFSNNPSDIYHEIGSLKLPSQDLIRYALSVVGINTVIIGIGHIDQDPNRCQLEQNLKAAHLGEPLTPDELETIEGKVTAAGKEHANAYFQRKYIGLTAPRNVGIEADMAGPNFGRIAVRVSWDTAYAGNFPIERYDIMFDNELVARIPHNPQITPRRFHYDMIFKKDQKPAIHRCLVRTVDSIGKTADSNVLSIDLKAMI